MPNYFQLTRKGESEPASLADVDRRMCEYFNVPEQPDVYHAYWYQIVGFRLACGQTFQQIRESFEGRLREPFDLTLVRELRAHYEHLILVVNWLEREYTVDAWAEIGRRA